MNRTPVETLFWRHVDQRPDGCWLWTGSCMPAGYGRLDYPGRSRYAHRLSYELHVGPIPDGLTIDHLCRQTSCVNPDHLEPVTLAENIRRAGPPLMKTHCVHGHLLADTRRKTKAGGVYCQACVRERSREWHRARARRLKKRQA